MGVMAKSLLRRRYYWLILWTVLNLPPIVAYAARATTIVIVDDKDADSDTDAEVHTGVDADDGEKKAAPREIVRRDLFPTDVRQKLLAWIRKNPRPSKLGKEQFALEVNLTPKQVKTWISNWRKRKSKTAAPRKAQPRVYAVQRKPIKKFDKKTEEKRANEPFEPWQYKIIADWIAEHGGRTNPKVFEKEELSKETGRSFDQITRWFINFRLRYKDKTKRQRFLQKKRNLSQSAPSSIARKPSSLSATQPPTLDPTPSAPSSPTSPPASSPASSPIFSPPMSPPLPPAPPLPSLPPTYPPPPSTAAPSTVDGVDLKSASLAGLRAYVCTEKNDASAVSMKRFSIRLGLFGEKSFWRFYLVVGEHFLDLFLDASGQILPSLGQWKFEIKEASPDNLFAQLDILLVQPFLRRFTVTTHSASELSLSTFGAPLFKDSLPDGHPIYDLTTPLERFNCVISADLPTPGET
jgi:hypothetical protein